MLQLRTGEQRLQRMAKLMKECAQLRLIELSLSTPRKVANKGHQGTLVWAAQVSRFRAPA